MKKITSLLFVAGIGLLMNGCVSKMVGGAVDIVTLGIVKNDVKETKVIQEKPINRG
jgi:hypothetical protein